MVVLAPLFGVLLGSAAAIALGTPRSDAVSRFARDLVRFYAVITFAPATAYAALLEGDWAALYLVRSGELRLLGLVACAALGTAAVPLTFDACARYARRQSRAASWLSVPSSVRLCRMIGSVGYGRTSSSLMWAAITLSTTAAVNPLPASR